MASMSISSASQANLAQTAAASRPAQVQPETESKAAPAVLKQDTVKLSAAAQARMMHRQGQSPALIAAMLGTNVASVDGYLNIKVAAPVSATPTPAPTAQAAPSAPAAAPEEPAASKPAAEPQAATGKA